MRMLVLSGSPKGEDSITYQYFRYVRKQFPAIDFTVRHIGRDIRKIESSPDAFAAVISEVRAADGVIWAFPVYHLSVPSQLKRFIELAFERSSDVFRGKYATALTTSVHYYDHLAHNYVNAVSCDLGMQYVDGFSAGMEDLMDAEKREQLIAFFRLYFDVVRDKRPTEVRFRPALEKVPEYVSAALPPASVQADTKIALVTDAADSDMNLLRMIETFRAYAGNVDVINLNEVKIGGGCLGCIRCGYDNTCVYKDDYRATYERIMSADCIVYAGSIRDRGLSSRFKQFFDRSFFKGHCPSPDLKQIGYIVSGPLSDLPDLRQELEARAETGNGSLAMFVSDESGDPAHITAMLQELARRLREGAAGGFRRPASFLGTGGHLLFRDFVYTHSGVFNADYRFYKAHGLLDFPQKDYRTRLTNFCLRQAMRVPRVRKMFYDLAKTEMASPFRKLADENK